MSERWHSPFVDFFRTRIPADSFIRPYAKRIVEDSRALMRIGKPWEHLEREIPSTLTIETSNICNANCIFCAYQYQSDFRKQQGVMSPEVFEKALTDYASWGGGAERHINLTPLVGEPLVDPHIIQRVKRAKDLGFSVGFISNGILLERIDIEALLSTGLDMITLSLGPLDAESYERIYRSRGKYPNLLKGLERLLKTRNSLNSKTNIGILFRSDVPLPVLLKKPDFMEYVLPHLRVDEVNGLYAQVRGFDTWGGQIKAKDLSPGMSVALSPLLKFRPCRWLFSLMVMFDGKVRACSCRFTSLKNGEEDGLYVGDIQNQSLKEIWEGQPLRDLHRSFGSGKIPGVCRSCSMYRAV